MRRSALLLALVVLMLALPGAPAHASCAEGAGPAGSPVIFVGTAREERRGFTRFDVREVWAGPDLAPSVWVLSGQEQPPWPLWMFQAVGSSVDADFLPGEQWVVGATESFQHQQLLDRCPRGRGEPPAGRRPGAGGRRAGRR